MDTSQGPRQFDAYMLSYVPPGLSSRTIGVLVYDPSTDVLQWQLPEDWTFVTDQFDREYFELLSADFVAKVNETGGGQLLAYLRSTLSNVLRISDPVAVEGSTAEAALHEAFSRHVPRA
jgi:hypothetical protein